MFRNYFIIGWRNLLRNKSFSIINISGLAIGMAAALLIGLWVFDELNFNKSFKNYDRIAMIYHNLKFDDRIITNDAFPYPIGVEMKNNFPEFADVAMTSQQEDHILSYGKNKLSKAGYFVEPQFAEMFSLIMLQGTRNGLKDVRSIFLCKSLAEALIGQDAVGKMIKIDNRDQLIVTGVFEDFPLNSQFSEIKMLMPLEFYFSINEANRSLKTQWDAFNFFGFALLNQNASLEKAESKMKSFCYEKTTERAKSIKPEGILHPMSKWHLYAEFRDGKNMGGKIKFVWMFGIVGVFVVMLACINFMNLSTARSEKRAKEIGVRKVMGSLRNHLINQFMSESMMVVIIAFVISLGVVVLSLPWFNELASKSMSIPWSNFYFIGLSALFVFITGTLAGSYPALYLSSFEPIKVLKGTLRAGRLAVMPRKVMVVFQFTISITLMIGTIVIFQQVQHAKDRPIGFDRKGIIYLPVYTEDLAKANYNSFRNDLLTSGVVENMAISDFPITGRANANTTTTWEGKDPTTQPLIAMNACSHDYPQTSGFEFVEGRDFSRHFSTDSSAIIVNQIAAKLFSSKSVIGKKVKWDGKEREIIGVIKNQVRWSPFETQDPHIYYIGYNPIRFITFKIKKDASIRSFLNAIETVLKKYDPGATFDYQFVDADYARLFKDEERIEKLASVFASLAVFISCIGIFGLASFASSQRTKEIGIRKVLGASVFKIWKMLSTDFVWLVVLAILISTPLAYYFSNQWLDQYEYRAVISWWIFAAAGVGALAITLFAVSYQTIKAAMADPVKSLRTE